MKHIHYIYTLYIYLLKHHSFYIIILHTYSYAYYIVQISYNHKCLRDIERIFIHVFMCIFMYTLYLYLYIRYIYTKLAHHKIIFVSFRKLDTN